MRAWILGAAVLLVTAGCISTGSSDLSLNDLNPIAEEPPLPGLNVTEPIRLNTDGHGYEPSISVGPDGTVYVTAHKASITRESDRLASWFWFSTDNGSTWQDMPSPQQVDNAMFAFEGDIAIDDEGRVYYVDTWAADNTLSRWQTGEDGPVWDFSRPVQGTTGVDDRPWLQAHGDGLVYYLGNNGLAPPAPNNLQDDPRSGSRIWFYRSIDAGMTFSPGYGFEGSDWCSLEAAKGIPGTVYVACTHDDTLVSYMSTDRGDEWTSSHVMRYNASPSSPFPAWTDTDQAGNLYHFTIDDDRSDDTPGTLTLARPSGDGFETLDVTPFEGAFGMPWISAGERGTVALTFYASETVDTSDGTEWFPYLMVSHDAHTENPTWQTTRLTNASVGDDPGPPGHFFENAIGPDNRVHVVFQQELDGAGDPTQPAAYDNDILYVRQTTGLNLDASPVGSGS